MEKKGLIEVMPEITKKEGELIWFKWRKKPLRIQDIEDILHAYFIEGKTQLDIAIEHDLSQTTINNIIHTFAPHRAKEKLKAEQKHRKLIEKSVKNYRKKGYSYQQIADMLGVSKSTVRNYIKKIDKKEKG